MQEITKFISCVALPGELDTAIAAGYNEIYVMGGDGIYKHHKLRGENRFIRLKVDKIPNFKDGEVKEAINFLPAGKIPITLFDQIYAFFKQVMEIKAADLEAQILICWTKVLGYHLIVPDQRVSKASVSYDWSCLQEGTTVVCDVHSHNTMPAFYSGTDNADDKDAIRFSGVVGKLKDPTPMTVWRFNYKDRKIDCTFDDIFEVPPRPVQAADPTWIGKVIVNSVPSYPYPKTQGLGNVGQNHAGTNGYTKSWDADRAKAYYSSAPGYIARSQEAPRSWAANGKEGNREGPYIRGKDHAGKAEFQGDFWNMGEENILLPDGYDERLEAAERALAIIEDPFTTEEIDERPYIPGLDAAAEEALSSIESLGYADGMDERFDEIAINHGKSVANVFCFIDDTMHMLNGKDDLNEDLIKDLFALMSEAGQKQLFLNLFNELGNKAQEEIQMTGL